MKNDKATFHRNRKKLMDDKFKALPIIKENEKVTLYFDGEFYINRNHTNSIIVYSLSLESAENYFNAQ